MKTKKLLYLKVAIIMFSLNILFSFESVSAADREFRFMHNDHDTLVIGEIIEITEEHIIVNVYNHIVSSQSLDETRKQLSPQEVNIIKTMYTDNLELAVGNYVVASLNKEKNGYTNAWGIYKVDSLDYTKLRVTAYSDESSVIYTDFINSGGIYNQYSTLNGQVTRYYKGIKTIIYEPNGKSVDYYIDKLQESAYSNTISYNNVDKYPLKLFLPVVLLTVLFFLHFKKKCK